MPLQKSESWSPSSVSPAKRATLAELYAGLRELALERVELALKVAVLSRAGISRAEQAERLGVKTRQVTDAVRDLQGIADRIDLGERPEGDDYQ